MPTPRTEFAIGVVNGILYAVGGDSAGSVVAYDPAANSWTTKAPMPTPRGALSVGVVNGILYAVGGFNGGAFWEPSPRTIRPPTPGRLAERR